MSKFQLPEINPAQFDQFRQYTVVAISYANQGLTYLNTNVHPLASWVVAALVIMGLLWVLAKLFLFVVRIVLFVVLPALAIALLGITLSPYPFDILFPVSTALCAVVAFIRR